MALCDARRWSALSLAPLIVLALRFKRFRISSIMDMGRVVSRATLRSVCFCSSFFLRFDTLKPLIASSNPPRPAG